MIRVSPVRLASRGHRIESPYRGRRAQRKLAAHAIAYYSRSAEKAIFRPISAGSVRSILNARG